MKMTIKTKLSMAASFTILCCTLMQMGYSEDTYFCSKDATCQSYHFPCAVGGNCGSTDTTPAQGCLVGTSSPCPVLDWETFCNAKCSISQAKCDFGVPVCGNPK